MNAPRNGRVGGLGKITNGLINSGTPVIDGELIGRKNAPDSLQIRYDRSWLNRYTGVLKYLGKERMYQFRCVLSTHGHAEALQPILYGGAPRTILIGAPPYHDTRIVAQHEKWNTLETSRHRCACRNDMRRAGIIVVVNVQPAGGPIGCVWMLTKDEIRAELSGEQVIFVSENVTKLCKNLPLQTVRKYVTPEGLHGRKERDRGKSICVDEDGEDVFQIDLHVDKDALHFFDSQCFRICVDTEPIAHVGFEHL